MAVCQEAIDLWRQILQKIYYAHQPVVTDNATKLVIDALIEDMITTLSCTTYDVDEVTELPLDVTTASETLISGTAGKRIVVVHAHVTATATASDIKFFSRIGAVDTKIYGPSSIDTGDWPLGANPWGWFKCDTGADLVITKTGGDLGGVLGYVLVDGDVPS